MFNWLGALCGESTNALTALHQWLIWSNDGPIGPSWPQWHRVDVAHMDRGVTQGAMHGATVGVFFMKMMIIIGSSGTFDLKPLRLQ